MAEFQEATLDTLMERLCGSISGFDREWVKHYVPATEEQIQQLQDIFAECHYTVPAADLYYLRRMGQEDGGLLENEWDGCEEDIGTVLKLLLDRENFDYRIYRRDLEEGLFLFSSYWAQADSYMKLSAANNNPMVTDVHGIYVTESFEKYLFQKAFRMYQRKFTYSDFESESVCDHHERKKKENCRTCPYCGETVEERTDCIHQMAESYGIKKHGSVTSHILSFIVQIMLLK